MQFFFFYFCRVRPVVFRTMILYNGSKYDDFQIICKLVLDSLSTSECQLYTTLICKFILIITNSLSGEQK